jgi:hypothetical protein
MYGGLLWVLAAAVLWFGLSWSGLKDLTYEAGRSILTKR